MQQPDGIDRWRTGGPIPMWMIVLPTICATIGMHVVVPALPAAAVSLHADAGQMQLTVSMYLLGLAAGHLVYGPLADAHGRRPALLAGLAIFALASGAAMVANGLATLLAARIAQALGACAGMMLGRVIIHDTTSGDETVRQLAMLGAALMFSPTLGPMLGGLLAGWGGWRSVFGFLALLGAAAWCLVWRRIPETGRPTRRFALLAALRNFRTLLDSRVFTGYAFAAGAVFTASYAVVASAPFVLTRQLRLPEQYVGACIGLIGAGAIAGGAATTVLVKRMGSARLVAPGIGLALACALALAGLVAAQQLTVVALVALMCAYTFGSGLAVPVLLNRAFAAHPALAGSAGGLAGCIQMILGTIATSLGALGGNPAATCSAVLLGFAVLSALSIRIARRPVRA